MFIKKKIEYEFVYRLITNGAAREVKLKTSGANENEALTTAAETARKKYTDATEISYTGKFRIIK